MKSNKNGQGYIRLQEPLIRVGKEFHAASWEEALRGKFQRAGWDNVYLARLTLF